jgi:hypothetical protein
MKSRQFQPTGVDALEDRLVMTAFTVPFTLVTPPASEVNPKFLNLTGRTESQINAAISNSFNQFSHNISNAFNSFNKAASKPGADTTALTNTFDTKVAQAFNTLSVSLSNVSFKLPYGHVNLNPVLQNRIIGSTGVTDTTTNVNTPSLQTQFANLSPKSSTSTVQAEINATHSLVTSDVNNYINLGVTNNFFKLTRGASLPKLS